MVGAQRAQPHLLGAPGHVLKPRKPSAGERAKAAAAHRTPTDGAPLIQRMRAALGADDADGDADDDREAAYAPD